ncbi:hypothetical protein IQ231_20050 [Cuspidothrix issatschenkoi LEGE 03284]|uniref:DUF6173 family protein n=1 Tax=Cuspidothrix issatschenkoi TaxID=230752 RepID=UPI001880DF2B|nr:DUF6173 family protein [Cuspidothrix issatschenkoi]MBE9233896.1 hypothetical protein [Cuspidothrix issatschenkoi LEGE 03284]
MAGDFDTNPSSFIPKPDTTTAQVIASIYNSNSTEAFYNQLVALLNDYDGRIGDDHEVGVKLANFGQTDAFYLSSLHYNPPFLITFILSQEDSQENVVVIQHINQVSISLVKLAIRDSHKPKQKNRFGFQPNQSSNS